MATTHPDRSAPFQGHPDRVENDKLFERWQQARRPSVPETSSSTASCRSRATSPAATSGASEPLDDLLQVAALGSSRRSTASTSSAERAFVIVRGPDDPRRAEPLLPRLRLGRPRAARRAGARAQGRGGADAADDRRLGRAPTVAELAQYLELDVEEVLDALEAAAAHHSVSLDAPREDGETASAAARRLVRRGGRALRAGRRDASRSPARRSSCPSASAACSRCASSRT